MVWTPQTHVLSGGRVSFVRCLRFKITITPPSERPRVRRTSETHQIWNGRLPPDRDCCTDFRSEPNSYRVRDDLVFETAESMLHLLGSGLWGFRKSAASHERSRPSRQGRFTQTFTYRRTVAFGIS